jgi:chorismate synthase
MSADPVPEEEIKDLARNAPLTRPRPGHADLVGMQKYNFSDARPILERASARETASRVALGAVARSFLEQSVGITILSHVLSIGKVRVGDDYELPNAKDRARIDKDPGRCADEVTIAQMIKEIEAAHADGDSLGGVVEVLARNAPLTRPRPGHADLVGMQKYNFNDARPILERASARETASRVALGAVARSFLEQSVGITILSHVLSIGKVRVSDDYVLPDSKDMERIDKDLVRCADKVTSALMVKEIEAAHADGDTLGGVVEVLAFNMPPGLGSYVHSDRRLDARLAGALMGIQAIKGVEVGDGFLTATRRGSVAHDEIEKNKQGKIVRRTDRAGGTEGGMSNGEVLRVRAAMKPISTVPKALDTIDVATGESAKAINQRSDVCAVPAAGVVAEAMVALVLAEAVLEKFGGDSVTETRRNFTSYMQNLNFS